MGDDRGVARRATQPLAAAVLPRHEPAGVEIGTHVLPAAIVVIDASGHIVLWNQQAEAMYGWTAEEVLGRPVIDVSTVRSAGLKTADIMARFASGERWEGSFLAMRKDGTEVEVLVRVTPMVDGSGRVVGMLSQAVPASAAAAHDRSIARILETVPDGFFALDAEWRFSFVNGRAEQMLGRRSDELLGQLAREAFPEAEGTMLWDRLRHAAIQGVTVEFEAFYPPHGRWYEFRAYPAVEGLAVYFRDINDRWLAQRGAEVAERRLGFLSEATGVLDSTFDHELAIQQLAQLCIPFLGDNCLVDIADQDGRLRQVAVAATDLAKVEVMQELRRRYPPTRARPNPAARVIATGVGELFVEMSDEMWQSIAQDDDHLALLRQVGARSGVTAPLVARGRVYGALSVGSIDSGRTYDEADLAFVVELGRRAGVAIDNARLYSELSEVAHHLQRSLLPATLPLVPGAEVAARYLAAGDIEVGGDFYDVFAVADGSWAALVGDVEGKGPRAAGTTGLARHTVRAVAFYEPSPARVLGALNDTLVHSDETSAFCTIAYARLRAVASGFDVTVCCGGHPLPFVLRADGTVAQVGKWGSILGIQETGDWTETTTSLGPGDTLVLYTDGVTERRDGLRFLGEDGLADLLLAHRGATADELAGGIQRAIIEFASQPPRDDTAIVVVRASPIV